jgi:hypothetical protein
MQISKFGYDKLWSRQRDTFFTTGGNKNKREKPLRIGAQDFTNPFLIETGETL